MVVLVAIAFGVGPGQEAPPRNVAVGSSVAAAAERARVRLEAVDRALALQPDSVPLMVERLRHLFVLGVEDRSFLDEGDREVERLRRTDEGAGLALAATLTAFSGAFEVVRAKHARWPFHKLSHVREGLERLDVAVRVRPDDAEIRYLRLTSSLPLPFFFDRQRTVDADANALATLLAEGRGGVPPDVAIEMSRLVLAETDVAPDLRRSLEVLIQSSGGP